MTTEESKEYLEMRKIMDLSQQTANSIERFKTLMHQLIQKANTHSSNFEYQIHTAWAYEQIEDPNNQFELHYLDRALDIDFVYFPALIRRIEIYFQQKEILNAVKDFFQASICRLSNPQLSKEFPDLDLALTQYHTKIFNDPNIMALIGKVCKSAQDVRYMNVETNTAHKVTTELTIENNRTYEDLISQYRNLALTYQPENTLLSESNTHLCKTNHFLKYSLSSILQLLAQLNDLYRRKSRIEDSYDQLKACYEVIHSYTCQVDLIISSIREVLLTTWESSLTNEDTSSALEQKDHDRFAKPSYNDITRKLLMSILPLIAFLQGNYNYDFTQSITTIKQYRNQNLPFALNDLQFVCKILMNEIMEMLKSIGIKAVALQTDIHELTWQYKLLRLQSNFEGRGELLILQKLVPNSETKKVLGDFDHLSVAINMNWRCVHDFNKAITKKVDSLYGVVINFTCQVRVRNFETIAQKTLFESNPIRNISFQSELTLLTPNSMESLQPKPVNTSNGTSQQLYHAGVITHSKSEPSERKKYLKMLKARIKDSSFRDKQALYYTARFFSKYPEYEKKDSNELSLLTHLTDKSPQHVKAHYRLAQFHLNHQNYGMAKKHCESVNTLVENFGLSQKMIQKVTFISNEILSVETSQLNSLREIDQPKSPRK